MDIVIDDGIRIIEMARMCIDVVRRHEAAEIIKNRFQLILDNQMMLIRTAVSDDRYRFVAHRPRVQHIECIFQDAWNRTLENRRSDDITVRFFKTPHHFTHTVVVIRVRAPIYELMLIFAHAQNAQFHLRIRSLEIDFDLFQYSAGLAPQYRSIH